MTTVRTSLLWTLAVLAAMGYGMGAVTLLEPLIGGLAVPVAILTGRAITWLWFWLLIQRDMRQLAAIRTAIVDGLMDRYRPGWREETDKPGDHGQA